MREMKWMCITKFYIYRWAGGVVAGCSTRPAKLFVKPTQPNLSHLIDLHRLSWVGSGWES